MEKIFSAAPPKEFELKSRALFSVIFPERFNIFPASIKAVSKLTFSRKKTGPTIKWQPVKISFYTPIAPSTEQVLFKNLENEKVIEEIKIIEYDCIGNKVSEWIIVNSSILEINFGGYNATKSKYKQATLLIQPEHCTLNY